METALAKITTKCETFYVLGIYRPPAGQAKLAIDIISDILASSHTENKHLVLKGDVNIDRRDNNPDNTLFEEELFWSKTA